MATENAQTPCTFLNKCFKYVGATLPDQLLNM